MATKIIYSDILKKKTNLYNETKIAEDCEPKSVKTEIDWTYSNFEMAHTINLGDIISDFVFNQEDNYSDLGKNLNYLEVQELLYKHADLTSYRKEEFSDRDEAINCY